MVEIFSTSVKDQNQADVLLQQLSIAFPNYEINFDLEDCDHILRIESNSTAIDIFKIVALLNEFGFIAHLLLDTPNFSEESLPMGIFSNSNYKFKLPQGEL